MRGLGFTLGDIPVRVDVTFWIIMGLFGLQRATVGESLELILVVEWIALVFVGILLHEMGHAVSFRSFGRKPSVVLYGMGGLTSAAGVLTPGKRLITTLAGPFVGFGLGAAVIALGASGLWDLPNLSGRGAWELVRLSTAAPFLDITFSEVIFLDLLFINVGWGLLNLIPLHPLDGGQSLEALLQLMRVPQAARITSMLGVVVAAAGAVFALEIGSIFLVLIMAFLGMTNLRRLGTLARPQQTSTTADAAAFTPELQRSLAMAEQALAQERPDEAVEVMRQEHDYRPSPQSARAYLAVLARTRRFDELEQLVTRHGDQIDPSTMTSAGAALIAGGRYESALRAAESAWNADAEGNWQPAVVAAAARAGLRDVDGAMRWLFTAADRGWDDRRRLEADPIFAEVRADPRLSELLVRMGA